MRLSAIIQHYIKTKPTKQIWNRLANYKLNYFKFGIKTGSTEIERY